MIKFGVILIILAIIIFALMSFKSSNTFMPNILGESQETKVKKEKIKLCSDQEFMVDSLEKYTNKFRKLDRVFLGINEIIGGELENELSDEASMALANTRKQRAKAGDKLVLMKTIFEGFECLAEDEQKKSQLDKFKAERKLARGSINEYKSAVSEIINILNKNPFKLPNPSPAP